MYGKQFMKIILLICSSLIFYGCTVLEVSPMSPNVVLTRVAIIKNPKVKVADFTSVLKKGFEKHGILAEIYHEPYGELKSDFTVTYTALRDWDIAPYMTYAEISIRQNGRQIAHGEYRHRGGGNSLSLLKWRGTKSKIYPLLDEMLKNLSKPAAEKSFE